MNKVVFLDRDGVLCKEKGYISTSTALEIFHYAQDAVRILKICGYKVIVITNQSGVAKGFIKEQELIKMNETLCRITGVDAVYYCPHYPNYDNNEVNIYIKNCKCRKPGIELMIKAQHDFDLEFKNSYFVGDRATDILAGRAIRVKTVLLESGYGTKKLEQNVEPDMIFDNLLLFAKYIENRKIHGE